MNPRGQVPARERDRLDQVARRDRERGPDAQHLLDHRLEVRGIALAQPRVHAGMAGEPLEGPCQRGRRGVVARHQQRHELVAEVAVARRVAVLVALLEQHGEHGVVAGIGAAAGYDLEQQRVEALHPQPEAAPRAARAEIALHERHREHPRHRAHGVERAVDRLSQLRRLAVAADAEDDPEDRLEREPLHALERHHPAAPTAQLLVRQLRDQRLERAHPLAVERRLDQPALTDVLVAVEQRDRVISRERPEELPALAGGRHGGIQPEQLPHGIGMREQHHRLIRPVGPDGDRVAEAPVHPPEEPGRPHGPSDRLPGGRRPGTGRES